ncbi:MAG: hypothetical protein ACMUEL_05090 [Flavobacteriales bacterium Tduv]
MRPIEPYLRSQGSEGRVAKANHSKKIKGKKRESIRSRHSRKKLKKSGKLYYGYKKHIGEDKNGMILAVHSIAANEHDSRWISH